MWVSKSNDFLSSAIERVPSSTVSLFLGSMRRHHEWVIMVLGRSLWEEPGSGIHRYSPTSTCSSWLMSRWYYFPRSWQGCLADLLGSLTEYLDGGWRNSFMPKGTLFSRNKASRHKLQGDNSQLMNKQMVLHVASCLPYIECPTNTWRNKFFSQWR